MKIPTIKDCEAVLHYNQLYSMWQGQLEEIADLQKENQLLRSQMKTQANRAARPTNSSLISPVSQYQSEQLISICTSVSHKPIQQRERSIMEQELDLKDFFRIRPLTHTDSIRWCATPKQLLPK